MTRAGGDVHYRVATAPDHDAVVTLLAELLVELGPPEAAVRVRPLLDVDLRAALAAPTVRVFLAEDAGTPVGLSRADVLSSDPIFRLRDDHRCGYVDQMYVRPTYRDRGVGQRLLELCEGWFRAQGIGHALLHAAPRALRFYARAGYLSNREMFKRL